MKQVNKYLVMGRMGEGFCSFQKECFTKEECKKIIKEYKQLGKRYGFKRSKVWAKAFPIEEKIKTG